MYGDTKALDGRNTLIVGGGGVGNGRAITRAAAAAGANVAVADFDGARADEAAAEFTTTGAKAIAVQADIRSADDIERMVATAAEGLGGLDVVITVVGGQAAFAPWEHLHETPDANWDLIFDVNLRYVPRVIAASINRFQAAGTDGTIVSVGSIAGCMGSPLTAAYGAAKAGLANLAMTVAAEYGRSGIRMNLVTCGMIDTAVGSAAWDGSENDWVPMGRPGKPSEVADATVFLASPLSSYITGQSLVIDGGVTSRGPFQFFGELPKAGR